MTKRAAIGASLLLLGIAGLTALGAQQAEAGGRPGDFDYYALVLSWSPTYCKNEHGHRDDAQCAPGHAKSFILHGLWPQYQRGWPSDCHLPKRPWVPKQVIAEMRPIMPDKGLVIHEYRAHGTCSGLDPAAYFAAARELYHKVTIPAGLRHPQRSVLSTPAKLEQQFLAANDWLKPNMIAVSCRGRNLLDVRLCFDKQLNPIACGVNENQNHLCADPAIGVPAPAQ
jgi:ribonuclease T2